MLRGKSDMNPVWCLFLHSDNSIRREDGPCTAAHTGQKLCQNPRPWGNSERRDTLHDVTCVHWQEETRRDLWGILISSMATWPGQLHKKACLKPLNHGHTLIHTEKHFICKKYGCDGWKRLFTILALHSNATVCMYSYIYRQAIHFRKNLNIWGT